MLRFFIQFVIKLKNKDLQINEIKSSCVHTIGILENRDTSGTLQKPQKRVQDPSGTVQKPKKRDAGS